MGIETLLALLTTISMLSAILMAAFAWKLNSGWIKFAREMNRRAEDEHAVMMVWMLEDEHEE